MKINGTNDNILVTNDKFDEKRKRIYAEIIVKILLRQLSDESDKSVSLIILGAFSYWGSSFCCFLTGVTLPSIFSWENLNRGVHFCLFFPFCLLITSDLRCVHPPPKNVLFIGALRGEVHALLSLDSQSVIPINGQKCTPPLQKLSRKKCTCNPGIAKSAFAMPPL